MSDRSASDGSANLYASLQRRAARARTLALVYLAILFTGTHIPTPDVGVDVSGLDKLLHLSAYAVLTFAVMLGWELTVGALAAKHYFAVWLVGAVYGMIDEATQIPVGRTADMNDWLADVAGIVLGLLAFRVCRVWVYRIFVPDSPLATWERSY